MSKRKTRPKKKTSPLASKAKLYMRRHTLLTAALGAGILAGGAYLFFSTRQPQLILPDLPPPPADALYKQSTAPIEDRVDDLLGRMSLEEKIGQMALVDKRSVIKPEDVKIYSLGGVLSGAGAKPEINNAQEWRKMVESYTSQAKQSRLGIPAFYGVDANHGHASVLGATIFPHAIGLGATGNTDLVKDIGAATAAELKATGINWNFSPSLDAPQDMRWGRVYEAFSEDSQLNAELGAAFITGTQAGKVGSDYRVTASAKHFLGTGSMVWGESNHKTFEIDQGKIQDDETRLNTEFLPPFKAAVDSGVGSVMVALSEYGDQRIIDSKYLLTDKLKGELGFSGFVVSDWYGIYEYAGMSDYDANVSTINAGLDMAMLPYDYKRFIYDVRKAVQNGDIAQSRIDDAVRRILYQKFAAGLFDATNETPTSIVGSAKHRSLAREAVAASAVLLKNNDAVLPLSKTEGTVLVAGSGADNVGRQSGAWTVEWQGVDGNWLPGATSILQGIRSATDGTGVTVEYELDGSFSGIGRKAEVGIAVVSEKPYAEGWGDNAAPRLDDADLAAIENLKQRTDKVVVVIISGRPLLIHEYVNSWDGLVAAWLPGSEGGGVADVLFGDQPFTGKLPITWPKHLNQVPMNGSGVTQDRSAPLFKRGYGLSTVRR